MKRFPKMKINNYTVAYSEETQEYKARANISLEGTLSQIIELEDVVKWVSNRMLCDSSEVDLLKQYIEKNKNRTCENCSHYMKNIGYCEVIGKRDYINKYYTCIGWTEKEGDSDE